MAEKRILIADTDSRTLEEFRMALGRQWEVTAVSNGGTALEEMKRRPYDALVAGLGLPGVDGDELLNRARKAHSTTVRFILASEPDRERVLKNVMGAHQFLTKPFDRATLQGTIERALAIDGWIENENMRRLVSRVRTFPAIPTLYMEVLSALRSPNATTDDIGAVIAKDMAMTTKLLQVLNSAYFGLPRKITDPSEAVGLLGFETTKSLILSVKLLNQSDKIKPGCFSIERLWHHSLEVARMAKELVWLETNDRGLADAAYAGGLLHDLGKVVLATNFGDQYKGAQSLARKQSLPLSEVEKEVFGASHGEVGAYLLGLWGMPVDLLEVAALHHQPSRTINKGFTSLTAVHVANVFQHETDTEPDGVVPQLDKAYLTQVGMLESLVARRDAVIPRSPNDTEQKPGTEEAQAAKPARSAQPVRKAEPVAAQAKKSVPANIIPPTGEQSPKPGSAQPGQWRYARVAAVLVVLLVAGLIGARWLRRAQAPLPIHARTAASNPSADQGSNKEIPASTLPKTAVAETAVSGQPGLPAAATATDHPATNLNAAAAASDPATKPKVVSKEPTPTVFKLQGIFYSAARPTAIINGEMVHPKEYVAGAQVLEIRPALVILTYKNQRVNLTLE